MSIFKLLLFNCIITKVLRDGRWSEEDASILVPGDVISIKLGDIIPADARLLDGDPLKIDQVTVLCVYMYICIYRIFKCTTQNLAVLLTL